MEKEITLTTLSILTGLSVEHLCGLIRQGVIPAGRKDGRRRLVPTMECLEKLASHKPGKDWKPRKRRFLRKPTKWSDLI